MVGHSKCVLLLLLRVWTYLLPHDVGLVEVCGDVLGTVLWEAGPHGGVSWWRMVGVLWCTGVPK